MATESTCPIWTGVSSLSDIEEATKHDVILQEVIKFTRDQKWYRLDEKNNYETTLLNELKAFRKFNDELTVTNSGILLKGKRIVLPKVLHLSLIHI